MRQGEGAGARTDPAGGKHGWNNGHALSEEGEVDEVHLRLLQHRCGSMTVKPTYPMTLFAVHWISIKPLATNRGPTERGHRKGCQIVGVVPEVG